LTITSVNDSIAPASKVAGVVIQHRGAIAPADEFDTFIKAQLASVTKNQFCIRYKTINF